MGKLQRWSWVRDHRGGPLVGLILDAGRALQSKGALVRLSFYSEKRALESALRCICNPVAHGPTSSGAATELPGTTRVACIAFGQNRGVVGSCLN